MLKRLLPVLTALILAVPGGATASPRPGRNVLKREASRLVRVLKKELPRTPQFQAKLPYGRESLQPSPFDRKFELREREILIADTDLVQEAELFFPAAFEPQYVPMVFNNGATSVTMNRVQHVMRTAVANCQTGCTVSYPAATASGNLLLVGYIGSAGTGLTIQSVSGGGGSWVANGACHSTTSGGADVDLAYNLTNTGVTNLTLTLQGGSDSGADIELVEVNRSSGLWSVDGSCKTVINPTAATTATMPTITTGSGTNDYIFVASQIEAASYCGGAISNVQGSGVTTPALDYETASLGAVVTDYVNVTSGTYESSYGMVGYPCPNTTATSSKWSASLFAFK